MSEPPRVTPAEFFPRVTAGKTLLVCAYADEAKCRQLRLQGAISLKEFGSLLLGLPREQEIIFYCA